MTSVEEPVDRLRKTQNRSVSTAHSEAKKAFQAVAWCCGTQAIVTSGYFKSFSTSDLRQ